MPDFRKPSIVDVIGEYLPLRRAGREFKACCPFHEDKTPSFYIDDDKGVYYCFGCGSKGDVIDFLMRWSGKSFKEVCAHLGIQKDRSYVPLPPSNKQLYADAIHEWIKEFSLRVQARLREIGQQEQLAKDYGLEDEYEFFHRQWVILETLHEDLFNTDFSVELYKNRKGLEGIVDG